jgi:hypothetical protein
VLAAFGPGPPRMCGNTPPTAGYWPPLFLVLLGCGWEIVCLPQLLWEELRHFYKLPLPDPLG